MAEPVGIVIGAKHIMWLFGALLGGQGLILKWIINKELKRISKSEDDIKKLQEEQWKTHDLSREVHYRLDKVNDEIHKVNDKIHDILKILISINSNTP